MELLSSMRVGGQPIPLAVMTPRGMVNFPVARINIDVLAITCGSETLHVAIKDTASMLPILSKRLKQQLRQPLSLGVKKHLQVK